MSVITCGSIHQRHEWFSDDSLGRQDFQCVWLLYYVSNFAIRKDIQKLHCVKTTAEQGRGFDRTTLVTAWTASVVMRGTAAIRRGWTSGRRSD